MKLTRAFALVFAVVAGLTLAVVALAAQTSPKATLLTQFQYSKSGDAAKLYALYSPKFRAACPFAKFKKGAAELAAALKGATIVATNEKISGNTGTVDYVVRKSAKVLFAARGDTFVKIKGLWYDEIDKHTKPC